MFREVVLAPFTSFKLRNFLGYKQLVTKGLVMSRDSFLEKMGTGSPRLETLQGPEFREDQLK